MQIRALLSFSAHHSEVSTIAVLWTQMQFAQCWLADGFWGSWNVPGEAGFPRCCGDGHSGPQSQAGQPDLPQLAVKACVFAHINISLPLIIHLANFKAALQKQLDVLGFYHIYILYFFSRACQWCIFKAFPSLRERLAAFTGQTLKSVLPGPSPSPQISFCEPRHTGPAARKDYLLTYKVGNENRASEQAIMLWTLEINMCCLRFQTLFSSKSGSLKCRRICEMSCHYSSIIQTIYSLIIVVFAQQGVNGRQGERMEASLPVAWLGSPTCCFRCFSTLGVNAHP